MPAQLWRLVELDRKQAAFLAPPKADRWLLSLDVSADCEWTNSMFRYTPYR